MPHSIDLQPTTGLTFNREWSLSECLRVLYERKTVILLVTALAVLGTAFVSLWPHRVYQSRATLEIQPINDNFLSLGGVYGAAASNTDTNTYMQTQAEILQQDAVLDRVARQLGLAQLPEFQAPGGVLARLRKDINVVPLRNTRVLQITTNARSPQLAADLANTLARTFIDENIKARQQSARETYESLLPALDILGRRFRQAPTVEASRHSYDTVRERANDALVASMVRQSNIRWVSAAQPATRPYKPNLPLNLAIGALGGLLLAIGGVLLREQNNPVLREPGEAGLFLTLPELGAIPRAATKKRLGRTLGNISSNGSQDENGLEYTSALLESFRATAASILSTRNGASHPRIFVVTSPQPTEGKTTVVSNLGIALAEIGSKVLLIDGDLRRPRLHQVFDQANSWGLSDVLREQNAIDALPLDVLTRKTTVPHLHVLPSGAYTDNIFGLLHSGRMSSLLPRFREVFDYVIVDAPPCLEFADARIMAQYAEQLVLVVRANYTDRRAALAAVQRLRLDGLSVMGVILNNCEPDSAVYRNYTFRGSGQGVS